MKKKLLSLLNIITFIIQFLIFLIPIGIMYYTYEFRPVDGHDLFILYGRHFFEPEHGRYFATALGNFLIEKIPIFFNVHLFDINDTVLLPIKCFFMSIILSIIASSFFLFSKNKKNKSDVWIWLMCYCSAGFLFFNENFQYCSFNEMTVFLEYIATLIFTLLFFMGITYVYTKDVLLNKNLFILFLLISFCAGLTVETLNVPSMFYISFVTLFVIIDFIKTKDANEHKKQRLRFFCSVFFIHFLSCILYYIHPTDHNLVDNGNNISYWVSYFPPFYYNFFIKLLPFHIVNIVSILLICFFRKQHKEQNIRFIICFLANYIAFIIYYAFVLFLIFDFCDVTIAELFSNFKTFVPYVGVLLFNNFLVLGYFVQTSPCDNKIKRFFIKFFAILLFLAVNYCLLRGYFSNIIISRVVSNKFKTKAYQVEEYLMQQAGQETVVYPNKDFDFFSLEGFGYATFLMAQHSPDFNNMKYIVLDNNLCVTSFSEDKKMNYKFSNLLKHKVEKFDGAYDSVVLEKEKEENSKIYYKVNFYK